MMDYYIILEAFYADDDVDKNLSMCTWDGSIWYFQWYDMDTILGLYWNGSKLLSSSGSVLNSPEPGETETLLEYVLCGFPTGNCCTLELS